MVAVNERILFFCNDYPYFMAHRAHVALRAAREGYEVHVAVGGDVSGHDPALPFTLHPVTVDRLGFAPRQDMNLVRALGGLVRQLQPDAMQFITMKPIVFGALAATIHRFPTPRIVATFPGLGRIFEGEGKASRARRWLVMGLLRRFFARPGRFATFENREDRGFMVENGVIPADAAIVVAGAGLDLSAFDRPHHRRGPDEPPVFLWASRLIRGKGLHGFVEAARLAREDGSKARFLVAGYSDPGHPDNIPEAELDALWSNGAVEFLGHVTDMPGLFARTDMLVLPTSYQEGLPRILIEAAAAGVPAIASNVPGCLEIVEHERTGLVLDDVTGEAIRRAIGRVETEAGLLQRLSAAAHDKIRHGGYDQKSVQDVFLQLFRPG
jgi:glycosyltransferase involved in cell wall biosynthesis